MSTKWTKAWKCKIPENACGTASIEKFEADIRVMTIAAMRGHNLPPGNYSRLMIDGELVMSDTPDEYADHIGLFRAAKWNGGHVLVHGLGMGCALSVLLTIDTVSTVTVVEKNRNVIDLVGPAYPDVEIVHDDAFTWTPPRNKRYGAVWHDIWTQKSIDNLSEMHTLTRRYGRRANWQGSWSREFVEQYRREGRWIGT